jgi:hypothetical protein
MVDGGREREGGGGFGKATIASVPVEEPCFWLDTCGMCM